MMRFPYHGCHSVTGHQKKKLVNSKRRCLKPTTSSILFQGLTLSLFTCVAAACPVSIPTGSSTLGGVEGGMTRNAMRWARTVEHCTCRRLSDKEKKRKNDETFTRMARRAFFWMIFCVRRRKLSALFAVFDVRLEYLHLKGCKKETMHVATSDGAIA